MSKNRKQSTPEHTTDIAEIKQQLADIKHDIAGISTFQKELAALLTTVKLLQRANDEKDKKIGLLESRIEDLEQYSRIDDIIITGLATKHQTYARATATASNANTDAEAPQEELATLEEKVVKFFSSKGIDIDKKDISACHTLSAGNRSASTNTSQHRTTAPPRIIVRFSNRKAKVNVLKWGKKLRGTNVYVNEHLTAKQANLAKTARLLRKQGKIQSTWTRNCKIFVKANGPADSAKIRLVKCMDDFRDFDV